MEDDDWYGLDDDLDDDKEIEESLEELEDFLIVIGAGGGGW